MSDDPSRPVNRLLLYGVPGTLGGAATKIRDLIQMLRHDYDITVVFGHVGYLKEKEFTGFLDNLRVKYCLRKDVPSKIDGVALGICEPDLFSSGTVAQIRKKGVRFVWSNEMMWEFDGEAQAVRNGLVDRVLFLSEIQRDAFAHIYSGVDQAIIRNYITPSNFPASERKNPTFTIGRLSRADPVKFPLDFPVFYEELGLDDVKYRVQAWNSELRRLYSWHRFGEEWELLREKQVSANSFLASLDLFVYPLGHRFVESWGRSAVEAMLTGCVPLVPSGHQFHNVMVHEESGFICNRFAEFKFYAQQLYRDAHLRHKVGAEAAKFARDVVCNFDRHRQMWIEALSFND